MADDPAVRLLNALTPHHHVCDGFSPRPMYWDKESVSVIRQAIEEATRELQRKFDHLDAGAAEGMKGLGKELRAQREATRKLREAAALVVACETYGFGRRLSWYVERLREALEKSDG